MKIGHMVRIYNIEPVTSPVRRALDRKTTPVPSHKRKDTTTTASTRRS